jgi:FkbM family methyltransferase
MLRKYFDRRKARWYDKMTVAVMHRVLSRDSVTVDVGAHTGDLLVHMVERAPEGRHFAFEPLPGCFAQLTRRFGDHPGVKLHELALRDEPGTASFVHVATRPTYSGLIARRMDRPNERLETIEVQCARLDDVIGPDEPVRFIKIDVEGGELGVFLGARETLSRTRPVVVFEHGLGGADHYGTRPTQVFDVLSDAGLSVGLLERYLAGDPALSRDSFADEFESGRNYLFVAYPARDQR